MILTLVTPPSLDFYQCSGCVDEMKLKYVSYFAPIFCLIQILVYLHILHNVTQVTPIKKHFRENMEVLCYVGYIFTNSAHGVTIRLNPVYES